MSITEEAKRCLKCKNARCSKNCPLETPVPLVMNLFLEGKIQEAGKILFENNPMTAVTALVCPHERNCYGNCVLGAKGEPVRFYEIEQYVSRFYLETVKLTPPPSNGIRIAVIDAGPAGITMSILLALRGFKVTLMEAKDEIGGVLRYGIPEFRLPNVVVDQYLRLLDDLDIKIKFNTFIGATVTLEDMFIDGYKAIFIAVGTAKPRKLGLLGETLGNVHYAIDFLKSPARYKLGKNVVVIGAGNVAMDAARMAIRVSPASNVIVLNNQDEDSMTATQSEIEFARCDGVKFRHLLSTIRLQEDSIVCAEVDMTVDENGKKHYEENMANRITIPADTVILAIGQGPQAAAFQSFRVERNDKGLISVDENGKTNIAGIFAAGDIVSGPRTVAEAVAFAKKAASEIEAYCLGTK